MKDKIDLNLNFIVGKGGTGKSLFAELLYDSMQMNGRDKSEVAGLSYNPYMLSHAIPRQVITSEDFPHCLETGRVKEVIWELATIDYSAICKLDEVHGLFGERGMALGLQTRFWLLIPLSFPVLYLAAKIIDQFARQSNFTLVLNDIKGDPNASVGREGLINMLQKKGWNGFLESSCWYGPDQQNFTEEEALQFLQAVPVVHFPHFPEPLRKLTEYSSDCPTIRSISENQSASPADRHLAKRFLEKANAEILAVL